jgi:hypothetical protein
MLGGEAVVRLDGEVDGAAPSLLVILLAGMCDVLHLLERLDELEDRLLLRYLLLRVWPVVGPVERLVVLRFRYRRCRFLLLGHQIRGRRLSSSHRRWCSTPAPTAAAAAPPHDDVVAVHPGADTPHAPPGATRSLPLAAAASPPADAAPSAAVVSPPTGVASP